MRRSGTGRGTRLRIGAQVGLAAALALVALAFVNHLSTRPGLRLRLDLTEKRNNTLSAATRGVLRRLERPVTIDVFFRPVAGPLGPLQVQVMERVQRLLVLMEEANGRIELRFNDVSDRAALDQRRRELRLMGFENCVVVTSDTRREVLRLSGDLAEFDPGNPDPDAYRPAVTRVLRAEERIVQGILEVLNDRSPRVYFSGGHGERDPFDETEGGNLGLLAKALGEDGFEVEWWRHDVDGAVPEDCAVLAVLAPTSPLTPEEQEAIRRYVDGGGRLVLAPPNDPQAVSRTDLNGFLAGFGVEVSEGIVCTPAFIDGRPAYGRPDNAAHQLGPERMAEHPVTAPLREGGRFLRVTFPHRVRITRQPELGATLAIVQSAPQSWLDVPGPDGMPDFRPDPDSEEIRPHNLVVLSQFQTDATSGEVRALEEERRARVVLLGTADFLGNYLFEFNRDFARNLFNWAADREYRVAISPRDPDQRRLPVARTDVLTRVAWIAIWGLPGLCALAGVVLALLRSRSGRRPAGPPLG